MSIKFEARHITRCFQSWLGVVGLASFLAVPVKAQPDPGLKERLDAIAEQWIERGVAIGMVVGVVQNGDTLVVQPYGKADVEWDVPMPRDAMFEIGSVTKQFTAAAIFKLRDDGLLTLDDELTEWLPDFDTRGQTVTLRHLLGHTSGLGDFTEAPEFGLLITNWRFPPDSAYALLQRQSPVFDPGEIQIYNNSGFYLLGLVVERASGMTYEDYVEQNIFRPLGMTRSMYCHSEENVPRRAHGYFVSRDGVVRRAWTTVHRWSLGAGSLCSTVDDMLTWLHALHDGQVFSDESYEEFIAPSQLNDGTPLRYSNGLQVGPGPSGLTYWGHGGRGPGFWVEVGWYPEHDMAIVVMINNVGPLDPQEVATDLANAVLDRTPPAPKPFTGDAASFVGTYAGQGTEGEMRVEVTDTPRGPAFSINGSRPRPFPWIDGRTFGRGLPRFTFTGTNGQSGPVTELRFSMPGAHVILRKQ